MTSEVKITGEKKKLIFEMGKILESNKQQKVHKLDAVHLKCYGEQSWAGGRRRDAEQKAKFAALAYV